MKEEELVTTLAYMDYIDLNIENVTDFFNFDVRTYNKNTKKEKSLIRMKAKGKRDIREISRNV